MQATSSNTSKYVEQITRELDNLVSTVRADINKVDEPKAQALFETTAEVLLGLKKAYNDYAERSEEAWR
jgi:hypothetical protein